jgi:hypothetical protein
LPAHIFDEQEHEAPEGQVVVQSVQIPLPPQKASVVPALQVPAEAAEQQPPLHGWIEEHASPHTPVVVSQASSEGQSAAMAHPHVTPPRQALPVVTPTQETQAPPVSPQFACPVPATHLPALLQQPPLHGWVDEHAVVQVFVVVSQAWSGGQSVALLQPHVPVERHAEPVGSPTQETHAPLTPHAVRLVPEVHVPALQHPPLQGCPVEHAVPQTPLVVSHASSAGQSDVLVQPHVPLERHAVPDILPSQDAHIAPVTPQAISVSPGAHVPALQHPPLQGRVDEHELVQAWVAVSHA